MNEAVEWLEDHPDSRWNLKRTRLKTSDCRIDGEPATFFKAVDADLIGHRMWMFCLKEDDENMAGMHWYPHANNEPLQDSWADWHYD